MSTIGELSDFGVADLIDVLTRRGRTGRLAVKVAGQEVLLYFQQGRLVLVSSTDITLRLGRMLIRQGLLDTPRLLDALHAQAESEAGKRSLGAIMTERGWITESDLTRCVEEQSIEALARVITDPPGVFVFDPGVPPPPHVESVPLDPELLLRAAKERTESLRMLRDQLPDPSTPLFIAPAVAARLDVLDDLAPPEAMVISVLKTGGKTYAELAVYIALDELSLGVAVLALIERAIVTAGFGAQPRTGPGRTNGRAQTQLAR